MGVVAKGTHVRSFALGASRRPGRGTLAAGLLATALVAGCAVRRYPTRDVLPPPADGRFHGTVGPITPDVRERMGETLQPGCPVAIADLRYVTVTFRGFDGASDTGELVLPERASSYLDRQWRRPGMILPDGVTVAEAAALRRAPPRRG